MRLITFDSASGDENVHKAMRAPTGFASLDQKQAAAILLIDFCEFQVAAPCLEVTALRALMRPIAVRMDKGLR